MRTILLLFLALPVLALNNSVTIWEAANANQTGRPISIARWFARGELANYPAPYVLGGAAITPWQADVKTRWSDGSVQFAIVSFSRTLTANGSTTVEFNNSTNPSSSPGNTGLTPSQLLSFNGGAWGAKIETVASGVTQSADARTMLAALASAPDQLRCWLCGPVVTQYIVEDRTMALAYDWGYQGSPITLTSATASSTTDSFTSNAHGLVDTNQVWLAVKTTTGGAVPGGLVKGTIYFVVNSTANTFQLAATSGGSPIDLTSNGSNFFVFQPYAAASWTAASDTAHKSLHPIFVITAYAAWPGIRTEYILENVWSNKIQDQYFGSIKLYSGASNATTAANMIGFVHSSRSRWRKICWDGTAPVGEPACGTDTAVVTPRPKGILVDYNFPYMIYSGATMPYDLTRTNVAQRIAAFWGFWNTAPEGVPNDLTKGDIAASTPPGTVHAAGVLMKQQYTTGADTWGAIGFEPNMYTIHRYVMGDTTQTTTTRMQAAELAMDTGYPQAYWSTHYRESSTTNKYLSAYEEPGQETSAFAKPLTPDARPTLTLNLPQATYTSAGDRLVTVGPIRMYNDAGDISDANTLGAVATDFCGNDNTCFSANGAHSWMPMFNSYLLLGDWYAMEELQYWAAWYTLNTDPGMTGVFDTGSYNGQYGHHRSWGLATNVENFRARAHAMRGLSYALVATPTEDAAYAKIRQSIASKYRLNLMTIEGVRDTRDGVFHSVYPAFTNWSCTGWNNTTMALGAIAFDDPQTAWCWGRMNQAGGKPNPLGWPDWFFTHNKPYEDYTVTQEHEAAWHWGYWSHGLEYASRLGVGDATTFLPSLRKFWIDYILNERFLGNADTIPVTDINSQPFTNWAAAIGGFLAPYRTLNQWCYDNQTAVPPYCNDYPYATAHSYMVFLLASAALAEPENSAANTGTKAWDWIRGNAIYQHQFGTAGLTSTRISPRYAWVPQWIRNVQAVAGTSQAVVRWSSFSSDGCKIGVSTSRFSTTDDSADASVALVARVGSYVATGLTPTTDYTYRITCGPRGGTVRATGSFRTAASGATSVGVRLAPPPSLGAATAVVDFGGSIALGNSTTPTPCMTSCRASIPATAGQALYYRVRYLDGAGNVLPTGGGVQQVIP